MGVNFSRRFFLQYATSFVGLCRHGDSIFFSRMPVFAGKPGRQTNRGLFGGETEVKEVQ